jgi:hemoglobin
MDEAAGLYNAGNPTASYYRFSGALKSIDRQLANRPQLQMTVRQGLGSAERLGDMDRRAWALHYLAGQVYLATQPPRIGFGRTLWERLGGEDNITKIMDDFLRGALKDTSGVNLTRNGRFPMDDERFTRFRTQLVYLASAVGGGPYKYEGKSMKAVHKEMGITDAEFDELLKHLRLALTSNGVKSTDVMAIMEMIPTVRGDIVAPPAVAPQPIVTLWDRLGGEQKVTRIVNDFVDLAVSDPRVNFSRNNKFKLAREDVDQLKRQFVKLASQVSGGPLKYEGRSMKEVHFGMRITDAEFDALLSDLKIVMNKLQVSPADIVLILKAVELTRKDVAESANTAVPAPARSRTSVNPATPRGSSKAGGGPNAHQEGIGAAPTTIDSDLLSSMSASFTNGVSPLGSFIRWAIGKAGGDTSASNPRIGGDHAP